MEVNSSDRRQEVRADYRVLESSADHFTIGIHEGSETLVRQIRSYRARPVETAFSQACADVVASYHPGLLDEHRGFAAARGWGWEDVLPFFSLNLPEGDPGGCTTVARRLPDGHIIVAHNYDYLYTQTARYLRRLAPPGAYATLSTRAGLIGGCAEGVNEHGLFVALHQVHARLAERVAPGVSYHLVTRIALETCCSVDEALATIAGMPHLYAFTYLLADPQTMAVVEAHPDRVAVRQSEAAFLIATNTFQEPTMAPLQGRRDTRTHLARRQHIERSIATRHVADHREGWAWGTSVMRDHTAPLCHHQPHHATLWSCVADLTAQRIAYALGAPCRTSYHRWRWPGDDGPPAIQAPHG